MRQMWLAGIGLVAAFASACAGTLTLVGVGAVASAASNQNAVAYSGTAQYLSGTQAPTAGTQGIFSGWFRLDGGDSTLMQIAFVGSGASAKGASIQRSAANKLIVTLKSSGTSSFTITGSTSLLSGASWHHLLSAWDTNFAAGSKLGTMYLDGTSEAPTLADADAAFSVNYSAGATGVAGFSSGTTLLTGALAEIYLNPATYLDFSVSGNRALFRTALGKPANLGSDGSTPTGTAPSFYLNNPAATVNVNKGSAANFTIHGTPTDASTNPWQ